jgi:acetyl-CoA acetyltransferase
LPVRLAAALGLPELRFCNLAWDGGGGGGAAALGNAAAAVASGIANCVVVYRSITSGAFRRGAGLAGNPTISGDRVTWYPHGMISPAQMFAMKVNRFMQDHGIGSAALRAIAMASYHHAQMNPRAVMYGKPLTEDAYEASRLIVEPFHRLFDCCMENDGASALIVVPAEWALNLRQKPVYVLAAAQGTGYREAARSHNAPLYASAGFTSLAPRLYETAGVKPTDIDTVQIYENFTGGVLMALVEHGFFKAEEANEFLTLENLVAPVANYRSTRAGAISPNAICTAWDYRLKRYVNCVATLRRKCQTQNWRSWRQDRWSHQRPTSSSERRRRCNDLSRRGFARPRRRR